MGLVSRYLEENGIPTVVMAAARAARVGGDVRAQPDGGGHGVAAAARRPPLLAGRAARGAPPRGTSAAPGTTVRDKRAAQMAVRTGLAVPW